MFDPQVNNHSLRSSKPSAAPVSPAVTSNPPSLQDVTQEGGMPPLYSLLLSCQPLKHCWGANTAVELSVIRSRWLQLLLSSQRPSTWFSISIQLHLLLVLPQLLRVKCFEWTGAISRDPAPPPNPSHPPRAGACSWQRHTLAFHLPGYLTSLPATGRVQILRDPQVSLLWLSPFFLLTFKKTSVALFRTVALTFCKQYSAGFGGVWSHLAITAVIAVDEMFISSL